jgi:hypothetical protein
VILLCDPIVKTLQIVVSGVALMLGAGAARPQRGTMPGATTGNPASGQTVSVGLLREDAVLVPFARFNGSTWRRAWPEPDQMAESEVPTLTNVPSRWWAGGSPVLQWELVKPTGARQAIRVSGTTWYECDYGENVGLATNYVTPLRFEASAFPQERRVLAGSVATRAGLLTPIRGVLTKSPEAAAIRALLPRLFARIEPEVWKSENVAEKSGLSKPPNESASAAYRLVSAHTGMMPDGRRLYMFMASHAVSADYYTSMIGWLSRRGDAGLVVVKTEVHVTDGDGKGDVGFYPQVSLTLGGRVFWMAAVCGYESGGYVLTEVGTVTPQKRAEMNTGGCNIPPGGTTLMQPALP